MEVISAGRVCLTLNYWDGLIGAMSAGSVCLTLNYCDGLLGVMSAGECV